MNTKSFKKMLKSNKGSQLIEFVVLLPIMLVITFGVIILGVTVYSKLVITDAAREASRAEALGISTADEKVKSLLSSSAISTDSSRLTVEKQVVGNYVRVKVTYKSPTVVPGMGMLVGGDSWGNYFLLTSVSEFKREQ